MSSANKSNNPLIIPVSPLLVGLSESKLRAHRNSRRIAQGYEANPPCCGNCTRFVASMLIVVDIKGRKDWTAQYCGLGNFAVEKFGICDLWLGTNGDRLEG